MRSYKTMIVSEWVLKETRSELGIRGGVANLGLFGKGEHVGGWSNNKEFRGDFV